jgi:hypothetical protein
MATLIPDYRALGLREFLRAYPKMAVRPTDSNELNIEGQFEFKARAEKYNDIKGQYLLRIRIPLIFPRELPAVYELEKRIPRNGNYHVNPEGSLCLGSRLRVLQKLARLPTLVGFSQNCLVPYLFAVSHKLTYGGDFPFGELAHGPVGELMDCLELFGLKTIEQSRMAVQYLGMKERKANKLPCPCGCGRRLGRCRFNMKLREFRRLAERGWFRSIL